MAHVELVLREVPGEFVQQGGVAGRVRRAEDVDGIDDAASEQMERIAFAYWFARTADVIENHLLSTHIEDVPGLPREWRERLRGRVMLVRRAKPTPVEWVVRGYVAGSGWKEYQKTQSICGIRLPAGLELSSRLPQPILTPTTKEEVHDRPISPEEARALVGQVTYERALQASLALFARGTELLAKLGILLADTKFEFGHADGRLLLIDEALTPDSSRFWPAAEYRTGISPPSFDKQIIRDWLETTTWNKKPPAPVPPADVLAKTAAKYAEVQQLLTR